MASNSQDIAIPTVHGASVTPTTQCAHWHSPLDIIAIKHACCHKFYACITCHNTLESHEPTIWSRAERTEKTVLCGKCKEVLTVEEYLGCGSRCTRCGEGFNPGCKAHWGLYFEVGEEEMGGKG
ncbi:zinc finger CHY domain-containing protein [Lophiotrema nucula]|uniref:Zinc finger CHY domain-containing protein n=1 Tax=Lophiotrema nucula TaxID=690887 RepID=A0A6A5Z200_9PLEO|nr:zinc finger CHY domain-containing protein [Lophiotrema nucula]